MAITYRAFGTISHGANSCTPAYPSPAAGYGLFMLVSVAEATDTLPTTPSGWTLIGSFAGGGGTFGVDAGNRVAAWYQRDTDATGSEGTGTVTVTAAGSATGRAISAIIVSASKTLGAWETSVAGAEDTTLGTGYSVTVTPSIQGVNGDLALFGTTWVPDTVTQSAPTLTWTGYGGAITGRTAGANSNGNDLRLIFQSATVAGTSSGNATFGQTASGSGATGATAMLLIHDYDPPTNYDVDAALAATSTITAASVVNAVGGISLAATDSLTTAGLVGKVDAVTVGATATITATASVGSGVTNYDVTAALAATDTITTAGVVGKATGATLAATATTTAAAVVAAFTGAALAATGTTTAAAAVGVSSGATLAATATITAAGTTTSGLTTAVALAATDAIAAAAQVGMFGAVSLAATDTITTTGVVGRVGAVALAATATITATAAVGKVGAAAIAATATITTTSQVGKTATVTLAATATIDATITLPVAVTILDAGPAPARWTGSAPPPDTDGGAPATVYVGAYP